MSINAPQQFVDLVNHDTGRHLVLRDVHLAEPEVVKGPGGRNATVLARSAGVSANWGGAKRFNYWRLPVSDVNGFVEIENRWSDWTSEVDIVTRFNEWLRHGEVFSSDELLISTYQLIGHPEARFVSVSVRADNLKYTGNVVFRIVEPTLDWTGMVFDLNGFKTVMK